MGKDHPHFPGWSSTKLNLKQVIFPHFTVSSLGFPVVFWLLLDGDAVVFLHTKGMSATQRCMRNYIAQLHECSSF